MGVLKDLAWKLSLFVSIFKIVCGAFLGKWLLNYVWVGIAIFSYVLDHQMYIN